MEQVAQPIPINDLHAHNSVMADELRAAVGRVIDRGWFVLGPEVEAFEAEFARYCDVAHVVGVANGTEAIELAVRALGIGAGDEVVLAANAGMYAAAALRAIGAIPVFADVDEIDLVLDPAAVRAAIGPRTRAIIVTHLYGRMAAMPALQDIARAKGLALIEDCAQSHGAQHDGRRAGSFGDAACFSFYPTKNLGALGDGGAIACRDAQTAQRIRQLRQYGWERKYVATLPNGRNSRLDEMQAAILRVKLPRLDGWNARRRQIAGALAAVNVVNLRHPRTDGQDYVAHLYVVRTARRDALRQHLSAHGITTDIHYPLLDTAQKALGIAMPPALPTSARACEEVLTLPCYPELSDQNVERVRKALQGWSGA